jgi:hypothetical protein
MPNSCPGVMLQGDGRPSPLQEQDERRFAGLSAMVCWPAPLAAIDPPQRHRRDTPCVVSARADHLQRLKTDRRKVALKQGRTQATTVMAWAEGVVKPGWAVLGAMQPSCGTLEGMGDGCQRAQQFQHGHHAFGEAFATSCASAQWQRGQGKADAARTPLAVRRAQSSEEAPRGQDWRRRATGHQGAVASEHPACYASYPGSLLEPPCYSRCNFPCEVLS